MKISRSGERLNQISFAPLPTHTIPIDSSSEAPYIKWIAQGQKRAEGRVNRELYHGMKVGETLRMENKQGEYVLCLITYKHTYGSFREMLESEGLHNMLPAARTIEEGVAVYESFPSAAYVGKWGVVAIGLNPLEAVYK